MKGLVYQRIEDISKQDNLTLHSDGTTNFGQYTMDLFRYQLEEVLIATLRLSEMLTSSAEKTLDTLKQIWDDIELATGKPTSTGKTIATC